VLLSPAGGGKHPDLRVHPSGRGTPREPGLPREERMDSGREGGGREYVSEAYGGEGGEGRGRGRREVAPRASSEGRAARRWREWRRGQRRGSHRETTACLGSARFFFLLRRLSADGQGKPEADVWGCARRRCQSWEQGDRGPRGGRRGGRGGGGREGYSIGGRGSQYERYVKEGGGEGREEGRRGGRRQEDRPVSWRVSWPVSWR